MLVTIKVPPSEVIDRFTVLQIKKDHLPEDDPRRREVILDLMECTRIIQGSIPYGVELGESVQKLREVNEKIWKAVDDMEQFSDTKDLDVWVASARIAHKANKERSKIKREIDDVLDADYSEVKVYEGSS